MPNREQMFLLFLKFENEEKTAKLDNKIPGFAVQFFGTRGLLKHFQKLGFIHHRNIQFMRLL